MARSLESLLQRIKELSIVQQRGVASIIGSTVADAATRPLHWIYNQEKLNEILNSNTTKNPEFWPTNECPFYSRPLGERSAYNDVMYVGLKHLYDNNGKIIMNMLCEDIKQFFGDGTQYMDAYKRRKLAYDPNNRNSFLGPVEGPWIQAAVLKFIENYTAMKQASVNSQSTTVEMKLGDATNNENDGFCLSIPFVALLTSDDSVQKYPSAVSSLMSNHENTLKTFHIMTTLLSHYISGAPDPIQSMKEQAQSSYPELHNLIKDVEESSMESYIDIVAKHGKACGLPGSFLGAYCAIIRSTSYVDAVRLNITAGGCNCSRANIIGACFGAKYGIDGIPIDWLKKTNKIEMIMEMAIEVSSKTSV